MKSPKIHLKAIYLIAFFVLVSCSTSGEQSTEDLTGSVAISNATILTMTSEVPLENHSVIIRDGKIHKIMPNADVPEGIETIDGSGKWLVPGLAEMHAHIPVAQDNDELVRETLFLYLSNGVTTIRGMLGNPYHLELRQEVENGNILGPRIYTSGPSINGNSAPDPETAAAMVREQKELGYDFLKLHPGLSRETFDEIDRVADEVGITFSGHVSIDVGVRRALEAKYASIDHLDGYVEGLVPESLNVDPASNGFFGINFTDIADLQYLEELVSSTQNNDVWIVPTQCLMERWAGPVDPEAIGAEDEMQYMSPQTRENWVNAVKRFQENEDFDPEQAARFIELRRSIMKRLHDAGVGLALGSDAPQIFNVPGFSIQHELRAMTDLGLSEYEALTTGTLNPARFFNAVGEFGQIIEGASADLILVNGNPLEDIGNMRNPAGVMVRGTWMSGDDIAARLARISQKYGG